MPASLVDQYLATLPDDRRAALSAVRKEINRSLPPGYEEGILFGMIGWYVPLSTYPAGYGGNKKVPLPLVGLGSPKSYMTLHMMCLYMNTPLNDWFVDAYAKSGKKLDMGKGCVRFKTLDALAVDVVGRTLARLKPEQHIASYEAARAGRGGAAGTKSAAKKLPAKKAAPKKAAPKKAAPKKAATPGKVTTARR